MTGLVITGGRKRIDDVKQFLKAVAAVSADCGVTLQAANADAIAGRGHIEFAVEKAIESFCQNRNLARDLGMEIMLYLRGRRQIEKALELGVRPGENRIALIIAGENAEKALPAAESLLDEVDPAVVDYSHAKDDLIRRLYEITPAEVAIVGPERIPQLVRERSALLEFEK
ncbi:MAG: Regulatory protein Cgi121 [Methanocella sp. PtaU1.Bin125]|nr:MAG: Regulatory protein Cgi121 [Methanocella sp. PtaU1.Bin125]